MKKLLLIVLLACNARIFAHDVVWSENLLGFPPGSPLTGPLTIYYASQASAVVTRPFRSFDVAPSRGEPCIVEVQMDPPESSFVAIENLTPPEANSVPVVVRLAAIPLLTDRITTAVKGRWRALTGQDPRMCDATNWTEFTVPIEIKPAAPWTISLSTSLKALLISTGGLKVGLVDTCGGWGPFKVTGYGDTFEVDWRMRRKSDFYLGVLERYTYLAGTLKDGSGNPLAGWQFGLPYGGLNTQVNNQGSFQTDAMPKGVNYFLAQTMLPYNDAATGKPGTQYVGAIVPIPSDERYESLDLRMNAQVYPAMGSPYVPWITIGVGQLNGAKTSLHYSAGLGAPEGMSMRDSGFQAWLISPSGMSWSIPMGARDENVRPSPERGTWTVKAQLPDKPAYSLSILNTF